MMGVFEEMRRPFLVGKKVYLRLLEESDIGDEYVEWLNDYEVTRYLETGQFPSSPEAIRKYLERFQDSTTDLIFAIVDTETDQHIGNVTLNRINWINRTADTGLIIGKKAFWGKGYAFEAWSLVLEYAFQRLGLRKIIAGAVVDNVTSITILKKLGFKIEGTFRQEFLVDGEYKDGVRLGLLREEFYKYGQSTNRGPIKTGH
jgi:RimJ/RimL family protein N-acetyltransferase